MSLFGFVRGLLERLETSALGTQDFTAALPLRAKTGRTELHALLRAFDAREPSPFASVPGLHSVRFVLLDRADEGITSADVLVPSGPLLVTCVLDGDPGDVLRELVVGAGQPLKEILEYCEGFPATAEPPAIAAFLTRARVKSGYFFDDVPDTKDEIVHALALEKRFREFCATDGKTRDAVLLRAAFEDWKRGGAPGSSRQAVSGASGDGAPFGYPFALSRPFEELVPSEGKWVRRVVELTRRLQEHDVEEARKTNPAARPKRVAHTKHHGVVEATFTVEQNVPEELRQGVFQPGSIFKALMRCSNTSDTERGDADFDGRGVSIKLLDVGAFGHPVLASPPPDGLPEATTTQDFLLLNHPVFFARDIHDFAILRSVLDVGSGLERAARVLLFVLRRPRQLGIFIKTFFTRIDHPFELEYHSTVPSLLGPNHAVKYSLSTKGGAPSYAPKCDREHRDYLAEALQASLDPHQGKAIELEFFVHVATDGSFPIEDATANWDDLGARKVKLASIRIEPQLFDYPERMAFCEGLVFSPWHALEAHKPLGSLSRARWAIYKASMEGRLAYKSRVSDRAGAVSA